MCPETALGGVVGAAGPAVTAEILVVDDEEAIRRAVSRVLADAGHRCVAAADAAEARRVLEQQRFDLMLCDVMMPNESGFSLLAWAHDACPDMAVIMVTAVDDPRAAEPVARYGAYGYIIKPFAASSILINVAGALRRRAEVLAERLRSELMRGELDDRATSLAAAARQLDADAVALAASQEETVNRLAMAAEWRDRDTGAHLQRMSEHCARLASLTGRSDEEVNLLRVASKMHDIGKVALPDAIFQSSGVLSDEERATMKHHSQIGAEMLQGSDSPLMRMGALMALTHHERWDGTGYPQGLAGTLIPVEGRIVAVADVFDALRSKRSYKPAMSLEEALAVMRRGRGTHFDPDLLDLFVADIEAGGDQRAAT
ncbi:MAG: HD-GYP domain-containing protein [Acidimicrobiales bacterium]